LVWLIHPTTVAAEELPPLRDGGLGGGAAPTHYRAAGLAGRIASDLQAQLSFPIGLAWQRPSTFLLGTAGLAALIASDPVIYNAMASPLVTSHRNVVGPAQTVSRFGDGTVAIPLILGFGVAGLIAGSEREKRTGVMLTEAVVTSAVWTGLIKYAAGRERPRELHEAGSDWTGPGGAFDDESGPVPHLSFPSGHATGAWATATILAHQYPRGYLVPAIAYGSAAAVSYSRMIVGAHWLSDVVVGGLIGYGCARQVISAHEPNTDTQASRFHFTIDPIGDQRGAGMAVDF
jgi:membrane-associated phospholipid phosphatase